jgi:hypothetical protein
VSSGYGPPITKITIVSATSMKLKLIDLGNAMPVDRTSVYYDDFEVQSVHYRAPEVVPFIICLIFRFY